MYNLNRDWEEGLPWLLLAACEVVQESTGFSPNDLVFGHKVHGLLDVLQNCQFLIRLKICCCMFMDFV